MELEALSASMKTRSKGSSELSFANDTAAGPIMMVTWLSTPAALKFSKATYMIVDVNEKSMVPVKFLLHTFALCGDSSRAINLPSAGSARANQIAEYLKKAC